MKHTLQIRVSKEPVNGGAVSVRSVSVRERLEKQWIFIILMKIATGLPNWNCKTEGILLLL